MAAGVTLSLFNASYSYISLKQSQQHEKIKINYAGPGINRYMRSR